MWKLFVDLISFNCNLHFLIVQYNLYSTRRYNVRVYVLCHIDTFKFRNMFIKTTLKSFYQLLTCVVQIISITVCVMIWWTSKTKSTNHIYWNSLKMIAFCIEKVIHVRLKILQSTHVSTVKFWHVLWVSRGNIITINRKNIDNYTRTF